MTIYVDTSALLRFVLDEPGGLPQLRTADALISSELLVVEGLRTIDRLRAAGSLTAEDAIHRQRTLSDWVEAIDLILLRQPIMRRASDPMPVALGTLDGLHLASALAWRDRMGGLDAIATHDAVLAMAARSYGFAVLGA